MRRRLTVLALAGALAGLGVLVQQLVSRGADRGLASVAAAPEASSKFDLRVADAVMRENWEKFTPGYFNLPEFIAYTGQGEPLFRKGDFEEQEFQAALSTLLAAPKPVPGLPSLQELCRDLVDADGRAFDAQRAQGFDFVLVEYWAEFCAPCKLQMKAVEAFRAAHPELRVAWLEVERDPTKIDGVSVKLSPEE